MCSAALGLGSNLLYTGDATTIPPGQTQLLLMTDGSHPSNNRLAGINLRPGVTSNVDLKFAYSYIWNLAGPDTQLGPNLGFKWRFAGDGHKKPSMAISGLYVINNDVAGRSHKNDWGATLIGSYPTRIAEVLFNFGHVWVGDNVPDLRYIGAALVRPVSNHMVVAAEYSSLERVNNSGPKPLGRQYTAGLVYIQPKSWSVGLQVGYLPKGRNFQWHTSLGIAKNF